MRALGAVLLALTALAAFTPLPNYLVQLSSVRAEPGAADAIVVLGGRLQAGGVLGDDSLRRTLHGILLYHRGVAPLLVLSGVTPLEGPTEAEVRAQLARELHVPAVAVVVDPGLSTTTRDEARNLKALLGPRGVRRIALVSDSQHLRRARGSFERNGFTVLAAPADEISTEVTLPHERLRLMRWVIQELLATAYYGALAR